MDDEAALLPSRLFTTHGTVLYVDPVSGELRHGLYPESPANARLVLDGARAQLMHDAQGARRPIVCGAEGSRTVDSCAETARPQEPPLFELVALRQRRIGLRAQGRFLCAEPDGRVTLHRQACCDWESFLPSEPYGSLRIARRVHADEQTPSLGICCIETRDIAGAARAVARTAECIRADRVYWFSTTAYPGALPGTEIIHVPIPEFSDFFEDINRICLRLLPSVVTTDFILTVQADGFATNPQAWDDRFWEYDYVGAPWPWMWGGGPYWSRPIVGNGGFSLRSRKLLQALPKLNIEWRIAAWGPDERLYRREYVRFGPSGDKHLVEDVLICLWYRERLERDFGIRFCPPELANKFSVETIAPFTQYWLGHSFGFHGQRAAPHYGVDLGGGPA